MHPDTSHSFEKLEKLYSDLKADYQHLEKKYLELANELKKVEKTIHVGTWYLDVAANKVEWSEELFKMYGFDGPWSLPPFSEHKNLFTPESWELLSGLVANAIKTGAFYELELNIIRKDGSLGWMWVRGEVVKNANQEIIGLWGVAQDISKRKEVEISLNESERLLTEMGEIAKVGGWQIELKTNKVTWTKQVYAIHEVDAGFVPTVEKAIGFYFEDSKQVIQDALNKATKSGSSFNVDLKIITAKGNIKDVRTIGKVILDSGGKPGIIYGSIKDITERKAKDEELLKNQYALTKAQEIGQIGTWEFDIVNKNIFWTKENYKNFGVKYGATLNYSTFLNAIHPDDRENVQKQWTAALQGKPYDIEHRVISNGGVKWLREKAEIHYNENGVAVSAIGLSQDITKFKDHEKSIQDLSEIIEKSVNEIYLFDADTLNFVYVNEAATANLGYTFEELLHKTPLDIKPEYNNISFNKLVSALKKDETKSIKIETIHRRKDGTQYHISGTLQIATYKARKVFSAIAIDITDRVLFEKEVIKAKEIAEENEQKFRALYDKSPDMFVLSYLDTGEVFMCNETFFGKLNYSENEIIGQSIFKIFSDKAIKRTKKVFGRLETTGYLNNEETAITTASGIKINVSLNATLIKDSKGKYVVMSSLRDITERIKLREKQQRDRQLLNETGRLAKIGGWEYDVTTQKTYYSQETKRIYGIPREAEAPTGIADSKYYPKEARNKLNELVNKAIKNGTSYDAVVPFINEQGDELWVRTIGHAEKKNGKVVRLYGTLQDVTEQKINEQKDIKFSKAIEQSPNCIVLTDANGVIEYVNPAFTSITGYTTEEAIGQKPSVLSSGYHDRQFYSKLWKDLKSGRTWTGEFCNRKKNGELYWESANISPVFDKIGNLINYLAIKEDITKTKNLIIELEEAKLKAEESDKLKSSFLTNMSHEIRTPMNGIIGFTDLLQNPDLNVENQREFVKIIQKSSQRLLSTVNDIIEISKIESGMTSVAFDKLEITEYLDSLILSFKPELDNKNLKILIENENLGDRLTINTDKNKFNSILSNLIKNAVKYTLEGYIKVGFKVLRNQLIFYCEDSGIGIPTHRQKAIFNRFEQADISDKRAFEGSGLGLAIVNAYVEMLGGRIWVESEENVGSTFYVSLPYVPVVSKETVETGNSHTTGLVKKDIRVLIAEDDEESAMHLSLLMEKLFNHIEVVGSGIDAVNRVKDKPAIDLVLMDMRMPGMGGLEATKEIREFNKKAIIIAQTAYAFEDDKAKAIKAGCNNYISKPIKKNQLFELVNKYFA